MTARILVVDDEQVVLDGVRKHLKREGYDIETVLSAREALAALAERGADVVITDLMMPEMDGLALLERVHALPRPVPVIMITGYATMKTALMAMRQGAFDYIAKPFTRAELQGVVARAVRQSERAETGSAAPPRASGARRLGGHCWVLVDPDGAARVGLEEAFAATVGEVEQVELPGVGDYVEQGSVCLRLLTKDGRSHTVWCPVSGSVLQVNEALTADPGLAVKAPFAAGWLLRVAPRNIEEDLRGLTEG
ncbi:MAG: response regulator [Planctomycetes bacterium]|jgi:CheY-like chemotaxis protein/glycine cleavage system H lipoate-binding protein|nr:response regulator [Planctomycetota bacterium]